MFLHDKYALHYFVTYGKKIKYIYIIKKNLKSLEILNKN